MSNSIDGWPVTLLYLESTHRVREPFMSSRSVFGLQFPGCRDSGVCLQLGVNTATPTVARPGPPTTYIGKKRSHSRLILITYRRLSAYRRAATPAEVRRRWRSEVRSRLAGALQVSLRGIQWSMGCGSWYECHRTLVQGRNWHGY